MLTLYLIRHGETTWNAAEVFRGRADVPLNRRGLDQAVRLGEHFRDTPLGAVLSSPMRRAWQTAVALAARHRLEARVAPELIDLDFGEWQGLQHEVVRARYPELYQGWRERPGTVSFPGGEALADVRSRCTGLLEGLKDQTGGVALVTHRVVAKVVILMLRGLADDGFWEVRLDTAAFSVFEYLDGWRLIAENQTGHLAPPVPGAPVDF